MRDDQIYTMNQRRAQTEAALYRQLAFLNTRMEAFEQVFFSPKAMWRSLWDKKWLKAEVDRVHLDLLQKHDAKVKVAAEKAKAEAMKPKLTIVGPNGR